MKQTETDYHSGEPGLKMPKQPETGPGIGETGTMLLKRGSDYENGTPETGKPDGKELK